MKAVIIGASSEALHTIKKAKEHGLFVVALDGNPDAEGLKAADKALVVDISDETATIDAVREETADFVLTVPIGRYLTTIGAVNDALGLPGISKNMAVLCTDKLAFHEKLAEKNLRQCQCYGVGETGEIFGVNETNEMQLSYPAILKPRYGSGSRGIHMVSDKEQLKTALKEVAGEAYVLEECVAGEEYGVDGAVIGGEFYLVLLRKKKNTPPPARQAVGYFSVKQEDAFWQQVYEHLKQVTRCLGLKECLFHADLIRGEKGPFVIELSARPSGHNLHNLFTPLCTGIDMAEEYIKYRLGEPYSFSPKETKSMLIHYFDMEGRVKQVPRETQVSPMLKIWNCNIKEGDILKPVSDGHSVMGRGYFILENEDQNKMLEEAERIKSDFGSYL